MKNGWQKRKLDDVCQFINGLWKGETPPFVNIGVFRNTNFTKDGTLDDSDIAYLDVEARKFEKRRLTYGDLILEKSGGGPKQPVGRVALFDKKDGEFSFSNFTAAMRVNDPKMLDFRFLHKFLFWTHLSGVTETMQSHSTGIRNLNGDAYKSIEIPLPPLPDQRRIVGILDEAFDGIATAKANAEKNLQNVRELFHSVLNAAITGELTREWRRAHPNMQIASNNLKEALTKRRKAWKGTGKYAEPQFPVSNRPIDILPSWTLASPEQLSTQIIDCPHSTPKWTESGLLCLRTTNFKPGFLDLESMQFVSEETYNERIMRLEPKPGDVLYSREGGILGIACIIPDGLKVCLGQRMMQFRLDTNVALPEFFTGVLNSSLILSEVKRLTGGAASPHLNIRDIRTFPIPLPPIAEQHEIIKILDAVSAETQRLTSVCQRKLAALDELKKSLLHHAFSGQLDGHVMNETDNQSRTHRPRRGAQ
jgi:type I restriction enzyme S subunit